MINYHHHANSSDGIDPLAFTRWHWGLLGILLGLVAAGAASGIGQSPDLLTNSLLLIVTLTLAVGAGLCWRSALKGAGKGRDEDSRP